MFGFRKRKIPTINLTTETRTVEMEVYTPPPYEPPTDKEMIEGLNECGYYAEACRIEELKKKNAVLKRKLTILKKKYETE